MTSLIMAMCAQTISQDKYKTYGYCCEIIEINFRLNLNVSFIPTVCPAGNHQ